MERLDAARTERPLSKDLPETQLLLITGLFWAYVALSNVLYAHSFSATLLQLNVDDLFAPWQPRVLQHLMLLVPLVGCFRLSLRMGWRPLQWRLPLQVLLAAGFATLPHWALMASLYIAKVMSGAMHEDESGFLGFDDSTLPLWVASGTNFLLQYGFGLALVTGFALYRRNRNAELQVEALERQSNAARLSALRMQLSPHTLFNLLNTIRGQIGWDPRTAQQLVVQLSELLRKLLSAGEREFSLLADELKFARLYLGLQQSRFSDRLSFSLPADDLVPALWVPSLVLQPLVENAVVHGLAGHDGAVRISVEVSAGDQLTILVVNDIAPGAVPNEAGIGLCNVRERLAVHFGDRAMLEAGAESGTWRVKLRIPRVVGA